MKFCPKCNAQYDYDMSFCLEDGTPLQIQAPNIGENTVAIPQNLSVQPTTEAENNSEKTLVLPQNSLPQTNIQSGNISEETVAFPKTEEPKPTIASTESRNNQPGNWNNKQTNPQQQPQSLPNQSFLTSPEYESEPRKSKTGLLIGLAAAALVLIGTAVGAVFYFQNQPSKDFAAANSLNINKSNSLQTNNSDGNTSVNTLQIFPENSNVSNILASNPTEKTNSKTIATTENTPRATPTSENKQTVETDDPVPIKTATPLSTPVRPTPQPNIPKSVSGGVLNGKAINLVRPPYPPAARAIRASGAVNVQVTIDENGDVVAAYAVSGHPSLRLSAEQAARASKFSPTTISGQKVKVTGTIVYNFTPQ